MADRKTVEIAWRLRAVEWLQTRSRLSTTPEMIRLTAEASGLSEESIRAQSEIVGWIIGQAARGLMQEVEMIRNGTMPNLRDDSDSPPDQDELPFEKEAGV